MGTSDANFFCRIVPIDPPRSAIKAVSIAALESSSVPLIRGAITVATPIRPKPRPATERPVSFSFKK
jgi:hypothetical protein